MSSNGGFSGNSYLIGGFLQNIVIPAGPGSAAEVTISASGVTISASDVRLRLVPGSVNAGDSFARTTPSSSSLGGSPQALGTSAVALSAPQVRDQSTQTESVLLRTVYPAKLLFAGSGARNTLQSAAIYLGESPLDAVSLRQELEDVARRMPDFRSAPFDVGALVLPTSHAEVHTFPQGLRAIRPDFGSALCECEMAMVAMRCPR